MLRENLNSIISLASMVIISLQCACTDESSTNFDPILRRSHPSMQLLECRIYHQTIDGEQTSPPASLEARFHAEQAS